MSGPDLRYWDSSCFLALIKGEKGRVEICEAINKAAFQGEHLIVTSTVAIAEVVRPFRKGPIEMTEEENAKIVAYFRNPYIRFVDLSPTLGHAARILQWRNNLHVRDSIHIASAVFAKANVIETYDPDMIKLDIKTIDGCPLIREPKAMAVQTSILDMIAAAPSAPEPPAPTPTLPPVAAMPPDPVVPAPTPLLPPESKKS